MSVRAAHSSCASPLVAIREGLDLAEQERQQQIARIAALEAQFEAAKKEWDEAVVTMQSERDAAINQAQTAVQGAQQAEKAWGTEKMALEERVRQAEGRAQKAEEARGTEQKRANDAEAAVAAKIRENEALLKLFQTRNADQIQSFSNPFADDGASASTGQSA